MEQNYYLILQVERTATAKEIKSAYRSLAKQLHPDINKAPDAHARFDELEKAYSVLIDEEGRRQYNEFLAKEDLNQLTREQAYDSAWLSVYKKRTGDNRQFVPRALEVNAFFSPEDVFQHRTMQLHIKRKRRCGTCLFAKKVRVQPLEKCHHCNGKGNIRESERTLLGSISRRQKCEHCQGTGYEVTDCPTCHGEGVVTEDATVTFEVPENTTHRSTMKLPGQGHKGINGGRDGDLHVKMLLESKPGRYSIDMDGNIIENIYVSALDFYDGTTEIVEKPNGQSIKLILPENSKPGYTIKFPGEGMRPSSVAPQGDLIFIFQATLPNLTEEVLRVISERVTKGE